MVPLAIEEIEKAGEPAKTYHRMIVGWQTTRYLLSKTVENFNDEYVEKENPDDMQQIALKRIVIASCHELKQQIDVWYPKLDQMGALSDESRKLKEDPVLKSIARQAEKFKKIRNLSFHYGDMNEETDAFLDLYKEIHNMKIGQLGLIRRRLSDLGESLWTEACKQLGLP